MTEERDGGRSGESGPESVKSTRRRTIQALGTSVSVGLAGCLGSPDREGTTQTTKTTTDTASDTVRAAFVYHDVVGDFGWQWAHDQGRRSVDEEFDWLETEVFEQCEPENSEPRFEQYATRGFDIVFATSFDYMKPVSNVAPDFPSVKFEHCSGYEEQENMGRYFGRMYQPRYLSGFAAGLLTDTGSIGYVAAFELPEVIRGINAFTLGVAAVNQDASVKVAYTDAWNDVGVESQTASELIDSGVDVIAQHQNYPAAAQTASEAGIWAIGYNSPMGDIVGDRYVTSPIWNWGEFYREAVTEVYEGSWDADFYWKGLQSGVVELSDWGPNVPEEVIDRVETERDRLLEGEVGVWEGSRFEGATDQALYREMEQYVANVDADTTPE